MQFIKVDHQSRPKGHGSCLCLEYGENAITERWLMGDGRWAVKVDVNSIDSLIKAFENKRAPQDSWIPIEDYEAPNLKQGTKGLIQTKSGGIYLCTRGTDNYSWSINESGGFDSMGESICDQFLDETPVYYQPLPELKK
jgi:hypothetical protein